MQQREDLTGYPRPNVAVDLALLTVLPAPVRGMSSTLAVLVQDRAVPPWGRALPGRFLRERQTVRDGVTDLLRLELALPPFGVEPELVRIFDNPDRDDRAWTMSLAHAVTQPLATVADARGHFVPVGLDGDLVTGETLLFDHHLIVREAAAGLRERYERRPDPDHLLGRDFTLGELRSVHEAVLGEPLLRDTFNRRMREQLHPTTDTRIAGGRPSTVYARVDDRRPTESERRRLQLPRRNSGQNHG
jgi:ADP-ribose pyrophosphatase YjhB (NUDIX family)